MKLLRVFLIIALLAPHVVPGTPSSSSASKSVATLFATELTAPWPARLAALAAPRTLSATFAESRTTPLKKAPVVVTGTVRIDRSLGLSLAYDQPHAPVVILDEKGLLLRHSSGREQSAPPSAEPALRLLHALFNFDFVTLEKSYVLVASEQPAEGPATSGNGSWALTFTRRPDTEAPYLALILWGEGARLTGIRLEKTDRQNIDIALAPPQLDPVFTPEDLARYFR